jgi:hypothetical protein
MWEKLNGNKTIIGGIMLFVASMINIVLVQKYSINPQWLLITLDFVQYIGDAIVGGGVLHKVVKKTMLGVK